MKNKLIALLWLLVTATIFGQVSTTDGTPLKIDRNLRVNFSLKVPSGKNETIESGGTFNIASGATFTAADGTFSLSGSSSGTSILKAPATGGGTATLPAGSGTLLFNNGNGSALTSLNATNISSGTLTSARLGADVWRTGQSFSGASTTTTFIGSLGTPMRIYVGDYAILSISTPLASFDIQPSAHITQAGGDIPANQIFSTGGAGLLVPIAAGTNGQYLKGVTGSQAVFGTILAADIDSDLDALAQNTGNGLWTRTGTGTGAARTMTAGSSKIGIVNGDGVSGNPSFDVNEANLTLQNMGGVLTPAKGGTGANLTLAIGDILYATSASTMAALSDVATGNVLLSGGSTTAPSYGKVTTAHTTGIAASGSNADITAFTGVSSVSSITESALGATQQQFNQTTGMGLLLTNPTAAFVGAQTQVSPTLQFKANGWATGAAQTQAYLYDIGLLPIPASSTIVGGLVFRTSIAGQNFLTALQLNPSGTASSNTTTGTAVITGGLGVSTTSNLADLKINAPAATTGFTLAQTARTSGVLPYFTWTIPSDTGITTATESIGFKGVSATRTWVDGTVALQRENYFPGPTYNKTTTAASFTDAFTMYLDKPIAGSGVTFTRGHTLGVVDATTATSSITGGLVISATVGTTATSTGIGGGNINTGGTLTAGGTSSFADTTIAGPAATTALTITQTARTTGSLPYIKYTIPSDTTQNSATEMPGILGVTASRQWGSSGTVALQREIFWPGPTYTSAPTTTVTDAFNTYWTNPVAGSNVTFTRGHTLGIVDATNAASSSITGAVVIANALGTTATSTGIGGGNINTGGTLTVGGTSTLTGAVTQTAKTTTYNNVATAGWGQPAIYGAGRATAQSGANASVSTYTVGAADGSFLVSANVNITTSSNFTFTVTCAYTDENNTARTLTLPFTLLAGTQTTALVNANGAVPYMGVPAHIRCKASTSITIATTGTFTAVGYNAEGIIQQIN